MSDGPITVHVNGTDRTPELDPADVRRAVQISASDQGVQSGEFSVTFCSPEAIAELARTYLNRTGLTDVIAFNLEEPSRPLGDVYICPAVARESAAEYAVEPREELLRLVIHGTLHVLGHDHPDGAARLESEMFRLQEALLQRVLGRAD